MSDSAMKPDKPYKTNIWQIFTLMLIVFIAGFVAGRYEFSMISFDAGNELKTEITKTNPLTVHEDNDASLGNENAPVVIINFSDYECPFCREFYSEILQKLKEDFIDTGKVRYVYRDFPLSIHNKAVLAANAAECAKEQEKYWAMHDILFEKQSEWRNSEDYKNLFIEYSKTVGLNENEFRSCMNSEKYRNEIIEDKNHGISYGVDNTPGLFVNGELLQNVPNNYDQFKNYLEEIISS